ncbi:acyl-CoA synthetase [Mycobacterium sp. E2497]|uniref:acyl-CoA synthetase n=1 Tax=Mycobacterium sp. E2497 TaxID=1834135 RepID=UPI0007FDDCB4|nr:acyl-CoA synthetase [Mycobacterium sp. E2497]OBI17575.1 acyl-CoA synthetase [Mycobacterium sp. E2497]
MSGSEKPMPAAGTARERIDDDDHDLLTFSEAGERLRVEIATLAAEVTELRDSGRPDELAKATARLTALRAAARRNAVDPINDANFEKFFGYPGKARRNIPGPPSA